MTEVIILLLVGGLVAWAAVKSVRRARKGGGCCGEHETTMARIKVMDRNKSHYPYAVILDIGGMTCENCARKVENALNQLEGAWAAVDIATHQAKIRLKSRPDKAQIRQAVQQAGYVTMHYEQTGDTPHESENQSS